MRAILRAIPRCFSPRLSSASRDVSSACTQLRPLNENARDVLHQRAYSRSGAVPICGMTACLLLPVVAAAYMNSAHAATEEEQAKACRGDAMKLCSDEIPNKEKIAACLQKKRNQLTPACRAMFKKSK